MTRLDPRALEEAARVRSRQDERLLCMPHWDDLEDGHRGALRGEVSDIITAYLAVTQPIVETVEELEGLAVGTVVEEDGGEIRIKSEKSWLCGCCLEDDFPNEDVILPARVIWRPHESP